MLNYLGIAIAIIFGVVLGRFTARLFNTGKETLNPLVFTLVGVIGSAMGAVVGGKFACCSYKTVLLQVGIGIVFAVVILAFLLLARGRKDPLDEDYKEEEN